MIRTGMPEFFMQESTPDSLTEKIPTFQKLRTMKQLFFHLVPVLAFGLVLAACDNDSDEWTQPYEFAWSYGAESQFSVGKPATFTDLSLGVETREWSFDPEPSVVFNSKGIKTVTLTIHFLNGQVQSESFDIEVFYPLSARIKALELTPKGCIRLDTPVSFGQQKRSPNLLQTHSGRRRNDNYRRTDFYCRKLSNAAPHSREGL